MRCDVIDGSIVGGLRQPIFFSFVQDTPNGCKVFCEPETIIYEKIKGFVLYTITFYLEDGNNEEVDFNEKRWLLHYKWPKFEILKEFW